MKNFILFLILISMVGCGKTKWDNQTPPPYSGVHVMQTVIPILTATMPAVSTHVVEPKNTEQDIKYGDKPMSSGNGKAMFQRPPKHKSRQVIHQVRKGFWIGGEK
jgi:hypothetical protein